MEATVIEFEGRNVIKVSPKPKADIKKGLHLVLNESLEDGLATEMTCDIVKGKEIYEFPEGDVSYERIFIVKARAKKK